MSLVVGRDIIIVGLQPWDTEIGSNCKDIALEFSKHNRVLYVNSPVDRITAIRRKSDPMIEKRLKIIRGELPNLELIQENLWVHYPQIVIESINWIKFNWVFDFLNRRNNRNIASSIRRAAAQLNFTDYILFNDNDIFRSFYLKEYLLPSLSLYYSRDFLVGVDYWKYHGLRLEPKLMRKSDICFANSAYLASICLKYNKNSFYIGQGCEVEQFLNVAKELIPEEMLSYRKPIIGYVGALQSLRLDIELIKYIASEMSNCEIVLVGSEDSAFEQSDLHHLPNVHFMGQKNLSELAGFINSFDVCINPQRVNEITIGNYPRKIDEYLAVGKPVVATRTESMEVFSEYVYLADTKEQYVELLNKALLKDDSGFRELRKQFAAKHTWSASVNEIYKAIHLVKGN